MTLYDVTSYDETHLIHSLIQCFCNLQKINLQFQDATYMDSESCDNTFFETIWFQFLDDNTTILPKLKEICVENMKMQTMAIIYIPTTVTRFKAKVAPESPCTIIVCNPDQSKLAHLEIEMTDDLLSLDSFNMDYSYWLKQCPNIKTIQLKLLLMFMEENIDVKQTLQQFIKNKLSHQWSILKQQNKNRTIYFDIHCILNLDDKFDEKNFVALCTDIPYYTFTECCKVDVQIDHVKFW